MTLKQRLGKIVASWLFDAANPRERGMRPFERVTAGGIHEELNPTDRIKLVSDSRKLFTNLGPAKAAIVDKAVYSFGRAWLPKNTGDDAEYTKEAEAYLVEEFYGLCDLSASGDLQTQLYLASVALDRDGDVGILLTEDGEGNPRIQLIPSHLIGSRTNAKPVLEAGPYKGLREIDGVVINDRNQPVAYHILGEPEDGSQDRWISARDFIFIFEPEWIGQLRGFPAFSHAILDLRDLRTVQGYERIASAIASSIGLIEHNETGMPDLNDPASLLRRSGLAEQGLTVEEMNGGAVKYFKANSGSKLEFLKNERPGAAWESFMNRLIRNAYAGANWPYELSWDSSQLGGANIRFILSKGMRAVEDRQDLFRPVVKRIVGYACAKRAKLKKLKQSPNWHRWAFSMPPRLTVDYGRDSNAQRADYEKNITNLGDILAEQGKDLDSHIAARKTENDKLKAAGLLAPGAEASIAAT